MTLPTFPLFKPILFSDRTSIQRFTKKYQPYSDFNFVSLYCWNVDGRAGISELNGNLVLRIKDYEGNKLVYSLLGTKKPEHTLEVLLGHKSIKFLSFVPKISLRFSKRAKERFKATYDRNHFDYIFSTEELSRLEGSKFHNKRNMVRKFEAHHQAIIKELDMSKKGVKREIIKLTKYWFTLKNHALDKEYQAELLAIQRFFDFAHIESIKCLGIYEEEKLISFIMLEFLPHKYAIVHFKKENLDYSGLADYATKELARYLHTNNYWFINFEQDLGYEGLRRAKLANRPVFYLKKYLVEPLS